MKEQLKKLVAFVTSALMALALVPAVALAAGTGTITIKPPAGNQGANTYKVYQVFQADGNGTNISYKLLDGKNTSDEAWTSAGMGSYFSVDTAGNVTALSAAKDTADNNKLSSGAIDAIGKYVTAAKLTAQTANSNGTSDATLKEVANGYYYITTSTGTVVTIDSTNPNATVNDKNEASKVDDKKITGVDFGSFDDAGKKAIAELGAKVSYEAKVTVAKGAKDVVFHDVMGVGLSYNSDAKVYTRVENPEGINIDTEVTDTSVAQVLANPQQGDTITVKFGDGEVGTYFVKYSATVTSDALTVDTGKNTASVSYGDNNSTTGKTTETRNAKINVTKTIEGLSEGQTLQNDSAEFVLSKQQDGKTVYYKKADNDVQWVNSIDQATKLSFSSAQDTKSFTGLADGTYTVSESKVPAGYNKAPDQTVTIKGANDADVFGASNLDKATSFENKKGSVLPTTGGMGTTLFTVVGAALVVAAGVLLVTRRRMQQ